MKQRILFLFASSLLLGTAVGQEIVPGRYIVELASSDSSVEPSKLSRTARRAAVQSEQRRMQSALQSRAVDVVDSMQLVANALIVNASEEQIAQIAAMPGVERVTPAIRLRKLLDRAVLLQNVNDAWAQIGGQASAGRGIKIGIIDTGIDASHPAFLDPGLQLPDGYPKVSSDIELPNTNSKVIVARNYDTQNTAKDIEGHGTALAMIAAGVTNSGPRGTITGVAPKAFLGNYKVFFDNDETADSSVVMKALDDAFADGMDIVNLSLGSFPARRFSEDPFARAVERAAQLGMIVVVAAGNDGPDMNTIASPATAPSAITVGNAFTDRIFASTASFANVQPYLAVPGGGRNSTQPITAAVADVSKQDPTGLACSPLQPQSLTGKIALVLRGVCFFEDKLNNVQSAGAVAAVVYTQEESPTPFTMGVGAARLPAAMISYTDGLSVKARIGENPNLSLTIDFTPRPFPVDPSRLSESSSKGPNPDLPIKPDIIAVGTSIYTAAPGLSYTVASGTSLSVPMVAGAAAVLKAARPGLAAEQYRSLLINSANVFGSGLPIAHTGSGLLNVGAALRGTVAANPPSLAFNVGNATMDLTRTLTLRNITRFADTYTITVAPSGDGVFPSLSTNFVRLEPGAAQDIAVRFQGTNLKARAYEGVLLVRGTQSGAESRIPYWYAVPSAEASTIAVIDAQPRGAVSSRQRFRLRVLDAAGVPLTREPKISAEIGDGSVLNLISQDADYPGFFRVEVRLGPQAGDNVFAIEAGGITKRVTIIGE